MKQKILTKEALYKYSKSEFVYLNFDEMKFAEELYHHFYLSNDKSSCKILTIKSTFGLYKYNAVKNEGNISIDRADYSFYYAGGKIKSADISDKKIEEVCKKFLKKKYKIFVFYNTEFSRGG